MIVPIEKPGSPEELVEALVLEHFGIKGMHWGIRKKEESGSGRKSAKPKLSERKEKRAKGHEAKARAAQKEIDLIKASPSKSLYDRRHYEKHRDIHLKAAKDIREGHLTDFQKKAIIGGVAVGVILAAYGGYKLWDTGVGHQIISRGKYKENANLIRRDMSPDEIMHSVVKPINPKYGAFGTKMNCRRATMAFEMRRRGYDVRATNTVTAYGQTHAGLLNATDETSHLPNSPRAVNKLLLKEMMHPEQGTKFIDSFDISQWGREKVGDEYFHEKDPINKTRSIFDAIAKHGNGSRGELGVGWRFGGGHSLAWENINGVPHIFDTQSGIHYDRAKFAAELADTVSDAGITRLDNAVLNKNYIQRWVRNV